MLQLLWFEVAFKGALGLILVSFPLTALSVAGLQRPTTGFWPRLVGATMLGIAAGVWLGLQIPTAHGAPGPAALVPINLFGAAAMLGSLVMGAAAPSRRGKVCIVIFGIALLTLAFFEIAHV